MMSGTLWKDWVARRTSRRGSTGPRSRRRLVGAVGLVTTVASFLPMVGVVSSTAQAEGGKPGDGGSLSITLAKAASPTTFSTSGQTINYTYTVTNTSSVSLSDLAVTDDHIASVSCAEGRLSAGASVTCTGSYTTKASDVGADITNIATATASSKGQKATATASATVTYVAPLAAGISLAKVASPTTFTTSGQVIGYTYTVTNTGNVALTDVAVSDDHIASVSCPSTSLAVGANETCTGSYTTTTTDVGQNLTNHATVTAYYGDKKVTDSASATVTYVAVPVPGLTLAKAASPTTFSGADQVIAYTYTVTNSGGTDLTGVGVTDDRIAAVSCPSTTLAAGASETCTGSYTTTASDVGSSVVNNATATAYYVEQKVTATATATVRYAPSHAPGLTLTKVASPTAFSGSGQVIAYTYTLTNTGNVSLTGVGVTDNLIASVSCPSTTLAGGAHESCTGSYTTTTGDVGHSVTNTATATGAYGEETLTATATATVIYVDPQTVGITLDKVASPTTFTAAGQAIAYTYTVKNTSSVALTGVGVTDSLIASVSCPSTTLAAGASETCTATYTILASDIGKSVTNVAQAAGYLGQQKVTASDSVTVSYLWPQVPTIPSAVTTAIATTPTVSGRSVTDTATVTSSSGTPTGTVTFALYRSTNATTPVGTDEKTLGADGRATSNAYANLLPGSYFFVATYNGQGIFPKVVGQPETFTIALLSPVVATTAYESGSTAYDTVTVTPPAGSPNDPAPQGTVTFTLYDASTNAVVGVPDVGVALLNGAATSSTFGVLAEGSYYFVASFVSTDAVYASLDGAREPFTVIATNAPTQPTTPTTVPPYHIPTNAPSTGHGGAAQSSGNLALEALSGLLALAGLLGLVMVARRRRRA